MVMARIVVKIQAAWRGAQVRKQVGGRGQMVSADLRDVSAAMDAMNAGLRPLDDTLAK